MQQVKTERHCTACNSFQTEDPAVAICPVCGNSAAEFWVTKRFCPSCRHELPGERCPECWEKLSSWQRMAGCLQEWGAWAVEASRRVSVEAAAVAAVTSSSAVRLARFLWSWLACYWLGQIGLRSQERLGRRMAHYDLGEASLRQRLAAIEDELKQLAVARQAERSLFVERRGLLLALAAAAMRSDSPLRAEIEADRSCALADQQALREHRQRAAEALAALRLPDRLAQRRLALGCAAIGGLLVVLLLVLRWLVR